MGNASRAKDLEMGVTSEVEQQGGHFCPCDFFSSYLCHSLLPHGERCLWVAMFPWCGPVF